MSNNKKYKCHVMEDYEKQCYNCLVAIDKKLLKPLVFQVIQFIFSVIKQL